MAAVESGGWPRFVDDMALDGLAAGIRHSLTYYRRVPADRVYRFGRDRYDAAHMIRTRRRLLAVVESRPGAEALNDLLRRDFRIYQARGTAGRGRVLCLDDDLRRLRHPSPTG